MMYNSSHTRCAAALCMVDKICGNIDHALNAALPQIRVPVRLNRLLVPDILMLVGLLHRNLVDCLFLSVHRIENFG